jgi:LmbE family N-acetylglucosaminyl deacetylase
MAHPAANRYVDITEAYELKLAALRAHASQTAHVDLDALIGGWSTATAHEAGLPEGRRAEAFYTCLTG